MSTIITRNSATSGSSPSSLIQGELALNVKDGKLFYGSGSGNVVKEFGVTSSYALNALSASYAQTASYLNTLNQDLTFNGNLTLNGTASIAYLNVSYESASVIYSSGSNQFGDASNDVQTLWGTVDVKTGPVLVTGSVIANSFTGSLLGTASYATNALSASYAPDTTFPYTGSALITGSLGITGSLSVTGSSTLTGSLEISNGADSVRISRDSGALGRLVISRPGNTGTQAISIGGGNSELSIGSNDEKQIRSNGTQFEISNTVVGASTIIGAISSTGIIAFRGNGNIIGLNFFSNTRNLALQNGGTFTDNNYRLQINATGSTNSGSLFLGGTTIATGSIARTMLISSSLSASANSDVLIGLDINPSFNTGSFTGTSKIGLRIGDLGVSDYSIKLGTTTNNYGTISSTGVIQLQAQNATVFYASTAMTQIIARTSISSIDFYLGNGGTNIGKFHPTTGNLTLQNGGTFTDDTINRLQVSGSARITNNLTASRAFISASNGTVSGSSLTVYGSGSTQPVFTVQGSQGELFSITDSLSGSLFSVNDISGLPILEVFSDNTTLIGNYQDPMLITTAKVVQTNSGSFTVYNLPTASYDTAFFEYSIRSGSNARAGTIMAVQLGSAVNFTETTTTDFGSTSAVSFTVIVSGSNMALTGSSTSGAWTIKTIVRGL